MANFDSVQHTQSVAQVGGKADLSIAWGTYEIASALSTSDTITFFTLPAGTTVHKGWLQGDDIDSGTEELEINIGDSTTTDRFLNSGVLTGDAITGTKPEAGIDIYLFGTLKDGPYTYTSATDIIGTFVAAAGGGTGTITLSMLVTYNDVRVSPPNKLL